MSDKADSTTSVVVVQEESTSFTGKGMGLDLKKLLRDLTKHGTAAIEKLVALMGSEDHKVALTAAKTLLEMQVQVAKDMNTDQLQRLIAQVKLGATKRLVNAKGEEDDDGKPIVDFTNIHVLPSTS